MMFQTRTNRNDCSDVDTFQTKSRAKKIFSEIFENLVFGIFVDSLASQSKKTGHAPPRRGIGQSVIQALQYEER